VKIFRSEHLVIPVVLAAGLATSLAAALGAPSASGTASYSIGTVTEISASCSGQNAETEEAADPALGYVYEVWMGCEGIGFARSVNGGVTFQPAISLPGSGGSTTNTWDPAIAVAPNGTVYASFMISKGGQYYPVVVASSDHGASFTQVSSLIPPDPKNWGDRDFIAVGPDGTVYLTWDYGPTRTSMQYYCPRLGSCTFTAGDLNVVMQKSTDGGKTWSAMSYISPGFPNSGADSAPLLVEPDGRIDVLYQGYQVTNPPTDTLGAGSSYFTSSTDGGQTWSAPANISGTDAMSTLEWWIDGDISADSAGNLYATWDSQGTNADGSANDIGWLSYSTNHGASWSAPVQVPGDTLNVPHITQVAGAGTGIAYVGWLSPSSSQGYAQFLRAFSVTGGWLSAPVQVSNAYGDPGVWPGDTFGIATLSPTNLVLCWGSATPATGKKSEIFAAPVSVQLP
jgi:BNR/Asp-box repeat